MKLFGDRWNSEGSADFGFESEGRVERGENLMNGRQGKMNAIVIALRIKDEIMLMIRLDIRYTSKGAELVGFISSHSEMI